MSSQHVVEAHRIIDLVWREMQRSLYVQREMGEAIAGFPNISESEAQRRAALGSDVLCASSALANAALPEDLRLTLDVAIHRAEAWSREGEWYWLVFDPMGVGFYAMFAPTAYAAGFLLNEVHEILAGADLSSEAGRDRYLHLIDDYARLIGQLRDRTRGQAERGIFIPQVQLVQSIELLSRFRARAADALQVKPERLNADAPSDFGDTVQRRIAQSVIVQLEAFVTDLQDAGYYEAAPVAVGMSQYPGGDAIYAQLVKLHTTLDLTPEQVHQRGLSRMENVRRDMAALFAEIGFDGSPEDYLKALSKDHRWRADNAVALQSMFQRYIDRLEPCLDACFDFRPAAGYGAQALPQALEASMTFGFYSAPNPTQPKGLYLFNARNLAAGPLPNIAALNYHELVPGHHFHEASQRENTALHPIRQHSFVNAFNEGWAEYAATLAGEVGMYREPEEKFGRLMMDAFLTCRLVVDSGMNALGWSLEEARDYMRANAFMPETEICSETVRYSCDMPGQSLAYKLGDEFILAERERMRAALGEQFSLRAFHNAVLKPGALPLPALATRLQAETIRLALT